MSHTARNIIVREIVERAYRFRLYPKEWQAQLLERD